MLKFITGTVLNEEEYPVEAVVFSINNTPVTHADLAKKFNMVVTHAGFCHVTDSGFVTFYGKSISTNKSTEGMDIQNLNEFIKSGSIFYDYIKLWDKNRVVFIAMPYLEKLDSDIDFDDDDVISFKEFEEEVLEAYDENIST